MKFSINDFFSKCDQIRSFLATFTEEILNRKLHFLRSVQKKSANIESYCQVNILPSIKQIWKTFYLKNYCT